ncbi:hypothetical protein [Myceligenerans salitolerans]|uniref:Uncharacterized protein n=1 Tax=Myceligenerans salitolerans TaxID=1230528 RepID=A0ABS3ICG1_9MICO|nr:hypothetical protein [Myceligenerans salitolerans]MBO0610720.1 hypothetical protein [Myceligenerans salitolerans]
MTGIPTVPTTDDVLVGLLQWLGTPEIVVGLVIVGTAVLGWLSAVRAFVKGAGRAAISVRQVVRQNLSAIVRRTVTQTARSVVYLAAAFVAAESIQLVFIEPVPSMGLALFDAVEPITGWLMVPAVVVLVAALVFWHVENPTLLSEILWLVVGICLGVVNVLLILGSAGLLLVTLGVVAVMLVGIVPPDGSQVAALMSCVVALATMAGTARAIAKIPMPGD